MNTSLLRWIPAIAISVLSTCASIAHAKEYRVYYLGGQSNMDGFGYTKDLSEAQRQPIEGCMIYRARIQEAGQQPEGAGVWATLTPGFGVGYTSDGKVNRLSDRFGPELTFGAQMQKLHPGANIAIIKYSRGGTAISSAGGAANWDVDDRTEKDGRVGINQYDHALKAIDMAMSVRDIDGDGEEDTLIPCGIVWMQGESDGTNQQATDAYEQNLDELMELLRAALRVDELPVVIGQITDSGLKDGGQPVWRWGDRIRAAQRTYCEKDPNAVLVTSTDGYGYSDRAHYDSAGYLDMGEQFARAMHAMETGGADD
jgi:hypothetical protein